MLTFPNSVPEIEAKKIIEQAAIKAGEKGTIHKDSLLIEINKLVVGYFERSLEKYMLIPILLFHCA
jgi:hypothetical protein